MTWKEFKEWAEVTEGIEDTDVISYIDFSGSPRLAVRLTPDKDDPTQSTEIYIQ